MTGQVGKSLNSFLSIYTVVGFLVIFSFKGLRSKGLLKAPSLANQLLSLQVLVVKKHRCSFPRIPPYPLPSISNWVANYRVDSVKTLTGACPGLLLMFACIGVPKNQLGFGHCRLMDQQEIMGSCNSLSSSSACSVSLSPKACGLLQCSQGSGPGLMDQTPLLSKREVSMTNVQV